MQISKYNNYIYKVSFSVKKENMDESCYLSGNFNCFGDGSLSFKLIDNYWRLTIYLFPGKYDFVVKLNQYYKVNLLRHTIRKPMKLNLKQDSFFHDINIPNFFAYVDGNYLIKAIWKPGKKKLNLITDDGKIIKYTNVIHNSYYSLFEFVLNEKKNYNFMDENNRLMYKDYFRIKIEDSEPKMLFSPIIYQIFPDRFCKKNQNMDNLVPWNSIPERTSFYGGNLKGIIGKIHYLTKLGINVVYLNPIYKSHSNHRYDVDDYFQVDTILGDIKDLIQLSNKLQHNNIGMIFDIVFNHTSTHFQKFQLASSNNREALGWYKFLPNKNNSKIKDYIKINKILYPHYETFMGHPSMPKLNHSNTDVINYFESILYFYLNRINIIGLRYDVADSIDLTMMRKLMSKIRIDYPSVIHIAEEWCISPIYFSNNMYDSSMNYELRTLIIDLIQGRLSPDKFSKKYMQMRFLISDTRMTKMFNLVGSHDTARIRTVLGDKNAAILAYAILMILNGMPSIYYGDEISMEGGDDPDNRRAFTWNNINYKTLKIFKEIVAFRTNHESTMNGFLKIKKLKNSLYEITKYGKREIVKLIFSLNDTQVQTINDNVCLYNNIKKTDTKFVYLKYGFTLNYKIMK